MMAASNGNKYVIDPNMGKSSRAGSHSSSKMNGVGFVQLDLANSQDQHFSNSSNISRSTTVTSSSKSTSTATTYSNQSSARYQSILTQQQLAHAGQSNAYIALFDYKARTDRDLSFSSGDVLLINDEDRKSNGWWVAKHESTNKRGYIPVQYVARLDSLEAQPWYFGNTKRMEAEKLLLMDQNQHGSFLIRLADASNTHSYSLSIRDQQSVKHYRIRDSGKVWITKRAAFSNLSELVAHYSAKLDGLSVQLSAPCIKIPPITEGLTHSFMCSYEVDRSQFELVKKIGQGQFGDVWQGKFIVTGMKVAIKTLKEGMSAQDFRAEADLMKQLCHPKLIQLYALCTKGEPIYIITELMVNGSLLDYLQTPVGKSLQLDSLIYIASQIAEGMAYLESRNYIHRDLAARNVLVGENNEAKVADFGLARLVKDMSQNIYAAREGTKFPIKWTAPEAAIYNKFSIKSDVWSFGIVLSEIITYGRTPYPSMSNQEVLQKVSNSYRMPQPSNCPNKLYQIMLNCWRATPEDRPTFESLKYKLESYFEDDENGPYRDTANGGGNGR